MLILVFDTQQERDKFVAILISRKNYTQPAP